MGKSIRFHKRVQKRHTRKHKPTRKKNRVSKKYSRKQRGGVNPLIATTVGIYAFVAVMGIGYAYLEYINRHNYIMRGNDPRLVEKAEAAAVEAAERDKKYTNI